MDNGLKKSIVNWTLLTAGSCTQIEGLTNKAKKMKKIHFPAHFFLLEHERFGRILVDTGYASFFKSETKKFPYSLYAKTTPIFFDEKESAKEQLKKRAINEQDISYVFVTHFHADHISGLRDFPNATFICSKKAYEGVKGKSGVPAVLKGFIPTLLPEDFEERVLFLEDGAFFTKEDAPKSVQDLAELDGKIFDVFGDGSLLSVDVSGHAHGMMGLFFSSGKEEVFLVADAAWDSSAIFELQYPSRLTKIIMSDYALFKENLKKLHDYHRKHPNVTIIPSHCRLWEGGKR